MRINSTFNPSFYREIFLEPHCPVLCYSILKFFHVDNGVSVTVLATFGHSE
jgi:hypothetical protein